MAKVTSKNYGIKTYGGAVEFTQAFKITYKPENVEGCCIWRPTDGSRFALTLFDSPSGYGKTTFLRELYARLTRGRSSVEFEFDPDYTESGTDHVAWIVQHPTMVNHWPVDYLIPDGDGFVKAFFQVDADTLRGKRLGAFSGGEQCRLYAVSAIEKLGRSHANNCFLLLDETFDGLGVSEAQQCLLSLKDEWVKRIERASLYVLVVTHLDTSKLATGLQPALELELVRQENGGAGTLMRAPGAEPLVVTVRSKNVQ